MMTTDRCPTCRGPLVEDERVLRRSVGQGITTAKEQTISWVVRCANGHEFDVEGVQLTARSRRYAIRTGTPPVRKSALVPRQTDETCVTCGEVIQPGQAWTHDGDRVRHIGH